jgi:hypothetical protein
MDKYPIPVDILPYCQGRWDNDTGKFVDNTSKEVIDCCLNTCRESVKFCFEHNDKLFGPKSAGSDYAKYKQNFYSCEEMVDDCYGTCFLYPSKGADIIRDCAGKHCQVSPVLDKTCVKNNQDSIMRCCKESCSSDNSIDCEDCRKFFDWVVNVREQADSSFSNYIPGSDESSLAPIRAKYDVHNLKFKVAESWDVPLIVVVVATVMLGIYIVAKKD